MVQDPNGAYSQLVRLQEGSKRTGGIVDEPERHEIEIETSVSQDRIHKRHSSSSFIADMVSPRPTIPNETEEIHENNSPTEEKTTKKRKKVSLTRLSQLNKPEIPVLVLGSLAAAVHGIVVPVNGLLLSRTIKIFFEPSNLLKKDSHFWALVFVMLGVIDLIIIPFQNYLFAIAGGKLIKRIRSLSFDKVVHQEISWFDNSANSR